MNNSVLGKYIQKDTPLHRIDARIKIFLMLTLMVAIILSYGTFLTTFIVYGAIFLFVLTLLITSGISLRKILSSLKIIWITLIFVFIINVFVPHSNYSYVLFDINGYNIYLESVFQSIKIFIRIFTMICMTMILTSTTKSLDIAYGFEFYFTPLKIFKVPVSSLSMIMSLALRFIPVILEETQKIKKAQESRGILFSKGNIFKRIKAFVSIIIPLLVATYTTSLEMADAMEARGYVPDQKRTRYNVSRIKASDIIGLISITLVSATLYYIASVQNFDIIYAMTGFTNKITVLR